MADHLTQSVDIETPELVVVSYTIAGLGSRVAAGLIDLAVCASLFIGTFMALASMSKKGTSGATSPDMSASVAFALIIIFQFVVSWGYYLLCEGLFDGQTLGKRLLRLRVVRDGGYSVGFGASAVRNLMRFIDLEPAFLYGIGIVSIALSKSGKRLGDIVAGTIVVRESLVAQPAGAVEAQRDDDELLQPAIAQLDDAEFDLLELWAARRSMLAPERRRALTQQVTARLARSLPNGAQSDPASLLALLDRERTARRQGAAARGAKGASRERHAIVATQSPRWIAFAAQLRLAQRSGLKSLGEQGVRAFVTEYRALSTDLARLRTATHGDATPEVFYLGRLVAGGHNLLYRDRRRSLRDVLRFIAVDVPTEVRRSFRPIALTATFLFLPAIIAYAAVVRHPEVAQVFIPLQMLDRAQEGVDRAKKGTGYIEDPQMLRPVMASRIIANNVQVTIGTFAGGITFGLLTLFLLVMNGVSIGGIFGLYQSKGIGTLLLAFVAPHGVLELSAICIGAAGGLLVAAALLIPGQRTRRRALAENSARAMRLLTAATLMLLVAGSLEGLVSPIPNWPLSWKLGVSAATAVLMILYLRGGVGSQQAARLDLEIPVDDRGGHAPSRNVEDSDAGASHASERLLSLTH